MALLKWNGNKFEVGGCIFQAITELADLYSLQEADGYILGKYSRHVEKYFEHLAEMHLSNILELGIFRGGSTVFFNELFRPRKLVAVDISTDRVQALDRYIDDSQYHDKVIPIYGVDQGDAARLAEICGCEFGEAPLDLVIDDASHLLGPTRTSFNVLFPRLGSGGFYVLEDWGWAHAKMLDSAIANTLAGQSSLATLVVEIMLASASTPSLVDELLVNDGLVMVRRGPAEIDRARFDISAYGYSMGYAIHAADYFPASGK